jgi:hypothetical protein
MALLAGIDVTKSLESRRFADPTPEYWPRSVNLLVWRCWKLHDCGV